MVSAVANNINILIEYKSPDGTDGFVDFAKAVAQGIYGDRRSLNKPSTHIQESGGPTTCGKECIKKRSAITATTKEFAPRVEQYGKTCIFKRTVKAFLTPREEDQEYCGKACILKRTVKAFLFPRGEDQTEYCGKACILKRTEEGSMKMEVRDGPEVVQI